MLLAQHHTSTKYIYKIANYLTICVISLATIVLQKLFCICIITEKYAVLVKHKPLSISMSHNIFQLTNT